MTRDIHACIFTVHELLARGLNHEFILLLTYFKDALFFSNYQEQTQASVKLLDDNKGGARERVIFLI